MRTVLYARVSVSDQTIAHQRKQAEAAGFQIDDVVEDHGVSGVTTKLSERAGGRRLFDLLRRGDQLAARWVDRLGRDYNDVRETIETFMKRGVVIKTVINGLTFDGATTDPMQCAVRDALIGFMAAIAQAQVEASKAAQKAGIEHAKANGEYKGRKPSFGRKQFADVQAMLAKGVSVSQVAKQNGLTRQTVYRIQSDAAACEAALASWGQ